MDAIRSVEQKIRAFKKRFYLSLFLRGLLLSASCVLGYYLLAALAEYFFWLSSLLRLLLLVLFVGLCLACLYFFLRQPLLYYIKRSGMTDEEAARYIGQSLPGIRDRLLNLLQLSHLNSDLARAGMARKAQWLAPLPFERSVDLGKNKRYLRYLAFPAFALILVLLLNASVITHSTYRIVHFNQPFAPKAPFEFRLKNSNLIAFRNEDFELHLELDGSALPGQVYLVTSSNRYAMQRQGPGLFSFLFEKLQYPVEFYFEAVGFRSPSYRIQLAQRPELESLQIHLEYPRYINRKPESLPHGGPLRIPEGTRVTWTIGGQATRKALIQINESGWNNMQNPDNQIFKYSAVLLQPGFYEVHLENEFGFNNEALRYPVEIIPDQYPQINVTHLPDSMFYRYVVTGGVIADDYGLTALHLVFHMKKAGKVMPDKTLKLPINKGLPQQTFHYYWLLDTLRLTPGDELTYYLEVFDNDGVHGRKSTRSALYTLRLPDKSEVQAEISRTAQQTLEGFRQGAEQAKTFKRELDDLQQKLKGRQSLDWQEKKRLDDLIEKRKALDQFIQQLGEQFKNLENKKEGLTEQDERIIEKARQLEKLINELLDDETRKLLEELQRLLQENARTQDLQKWLDELSRNSRNLEKELERAHELLKRHQLEYQLEQTTRNLSNLINKQQELQQQTENAITDPTKSSQNHDLAGQQNEIKQAFEKIREELNELEQLSKETGNQLDLPEEDQQEDVASEMEKSRENLEQNRPDKARGPQQKAIDNMKQMQNKLEQEMADAMMELNMENLELLRHILHGLIQISHNQEDILSNLRSLPGNDPRFNTLAQQQIKLKDDVKVLEDSLLALASRDPLMGSFVTREITELDMHIRKAIEANNEKRRGPALNAMQLSMTSLNNLAMMLDSHYDALMEMVANAKPSRSKGKKGKPTLSELQRQLNQKIEELKNSGKQGRELSEELARLAAEQERIRKALREFEEKMKQKKGRGAGDELEAEMEETEMDLVNKKLTEELIQRQRQILTRLLEAEKSAREQDEDDERKGETARDYDRIMPKAIEEYLKQKEKETEILRTLPPRLHPYYQREIDEYLKRLKDKN